MSLQPGPDIDRFLERDPRAVPVLDDRLDLRAGRLAALIDTRRELLDGLERHPEWVQKEAEVAQLLNSLLNLGSLRLLRVDVNTPASLRDQVVKYEAVHRIRDARDFERRTAEDRRCYAFQHPALPNDLLIFTELAFTHGMSSNAQTLLDSHSPTVDPSTCNCAIFYSISSCHEGLRGVPLGNALISQVTDELARVFPGLETFATLSPVPSFRSWLSNVARSYPDGAAHVVASAALDSLERSNWHLNADLSAELERQLVPLCAYYLLNVKRGNEPADPVARFHLRNGARLDRINWLSDTSTVGMSRSAGLMVNYVYRCNSPGREYDAVRSTGNLQASDEVERLAVQASSQFYQ